MLGIKIKMTGPNFEIELLMENSTEATIAVFDTNGNPKRVYQSKNLRQMGNDLKSLSDTDKINWVNQQSGLIAFNSNLGDIKKLEWVNSLKRVISHSLFDSSLLT